MEETVDKVDEMEEQIRDIEILISKTTQQIRRMNRKNSDGDDEKVDLLLKEIQNMKTQMFILHQSMIQLRAQDQFTLEVSDGEVGPAYNDALSTDLAELKTKVEMLTGQFLELETQALNNNFITRMQFDIRNNAFVEKLDDMEDNVDNARLVADACEAASESVKRDITELTTLIQEVSEMSISLEYG